MTTGSSGDLSPMALSERLCLEQRERWLRGDCVLAEDLLEAHSDLQADREAIFTLIRSEYLLRRKLGEDPAPETFGRRFPEFEERLRRQVGLGVVLDSDNGLIPMGETVKLAGGFRSEDPAAEPFPGSERFRVLGRLGSGGMGTVYKVRDLRWDQSVALKTFHQYGPDALLQLKQEFRVLADLAHPNLVQLFELFSSEGKSFFTMELLDGADFVTGCRQRMAGDGASRFGLLRGFLAQLSSGLQALHEARKLHCDIKPSNVLITKRGRVVLLDFGLALSGELATGFSSSLRGTVPYISPEQFRGEPVAPASDWYGVGVTLYQVLTGKLPFSGGPMEMLRAKQQSDPPAPRESDPNVPEALDRLCLGLMQRNPDQRPSGPEVIERLARPEERIRMIPPTALLEGADLFVGREVELTTLRRAFEEGEQAAQVSVFIHGPSGIGKTALVQRFLTELSYRRDVLVLSGRCYEQESVPFKAFDSLVDELCLHLRTLPEGEVRDLLPVELPALVQVFPVLRRVDALAAAVADRELENDRQLFRQRAFAAFRELLARLAERKRLVLLIDDLQWADSDSAGLMAELLGAGTMPLLLITCCRDEGLSGHPFLARLEELTQRAPLWTVELALAELSSAEAIELARRTSVEERDRAAWIAADSGGHPFLLLEMMRFAPARNPDPGQAHLRADEALRARAAQLDGEARRLLELFAVAGHPLEPEEACRAAQIHGDPQKALGTLKSAHFLRSVETAGVIRAEPYHDRIRESVTAGLPEAVRREHHRKLAITLESGREPNPQQLAYHYHGAGVPARACEFATIAARKAAEALAFEEAARLYRLALETSVRDSGETASLHRELADALANAGHGAEAAREYEISLTHASGAEAAQVRRLIAEQHLRVGQIEEGISVLLPLVREVGVDLPKTAPGRVLKALVLTLALQWRGLDFRERSADEIPIAELERTDVLFATSMYASLYDQVQGWLLGVHHLLTALRTGEPQRAGMALVQAAAILSQSRGGPKRRQRARELLDRADDIALRLQDPTLTGWSQGARAFWAIFWGYWREAHTMAHRSTAVLRQETTGNWWIVGMFEHHAVVAAYWLGQFAELRSRVPELIHEAERRGDILSAHWLRFGYANATWLAGDEIQTARDQLDRAVEEIPCQPHSVDHMLTALAELNWRLYTADVPGLRRELPLAWQRVRRAGQLRIPLFRSHLRTLRATALLLIATHEPDRATLLRQVRREVRKLEREKLPWIAATTRLIRGQLDFLSGDVDRAVEHLRVALPDFEDREMAFHAAVTRQSFGRLIGGEQGRREIASASGYFIDQQIAAPERMSRIVAPVFAGLP